MSSPNDLPEFRYHPDPIGTKVFVQSKASCPCCGEARGWVYQGPYYCLEEAEDLCPWCISSGRAAANLDVEFGQEETIEDGASPAATEELLRRTPWHFVAQLEKWPVHCGDYCAVLGRLEPELLDRHFDELAADLEATRAYLGVPSDIWEADLRRQFSPLWAYLFRCLRCGTHRMNADYE